MLLNQRLGERGEGRALQPERGVEAVDGRKTEDQNVGVGCGLERPGANSVNVAERLVAVANAKCALDDGGQRHRERAHLVERQAKTERMPTLVQAVETHPAVGLDHIAGEARFLFRHVPTRSTTAFAKG